MGVPRTRQSPAAHKRRPRAACARTASGTAPSLLTVRADGDGRRRPHLSAPVQRGPCVQEARPPPTSQVRSEALPAAAQLPALGASASGACLGCWLVTGPHPLTWLKHLLWDFPRASSGLACPRTCRMPASRPPARDSTRVKPGALGSAQAPSPATLPPAAPRVGPPRAGPPRAPPGRPAVLGAPSLLLSLPGTPAGQLSGLLGQVSFPHHSSFLPSASGSVLLAYFTESMERYFPHCSLGALMLVF